LEDEFSRYGRIRDFHMRDGYAFVTYDDSRDAEDAVHDMDGRRFDGARLIVEFAKERGERKERTNVRPSGEFRVLVEGIPDRTSWQDLKDHMKGPAEVGFCDVTGNGKGWAEYKSQADMDLAIKELDGSTYRGEKLTCFAEGQSSARRSRSPSPSRKRSRSRSRSGSRRSRSGSRSPSPSKKQREDSPRD
jgi:RNA recognition motif-containing protein